MSALRLVAVLRSHGFDTDLLVIGCGMAGSAAALQAARQGLHVTMLSSAVHTEDCNSFWAQGGIIYKAKVGSPFEAWVVICRHWSSLVVAWTCVRYAGAISCVHVIGDIDGASPGKRRHPGHGLEWRVGSRRTAVQKA